MKTNQTIHPLPSSALPSRRIALLLSVITTCCTMTPASAQNVPPFMNYQGRVTASTGVGIGETTPEARRVIFRLFASSTPGGSPLWTEEQTVTLSKGDFSVLLGLGIVFGSEPRPALDTVFTGDRYLEITVDNGDGNINGSDTPILPRQRITSTAYSFRAKTADSVVAGSIGTASLADASITMDKMASNAVSSSTIADGAIGAEDLADGSVTLSKLATASVDSSKIADGQVALADLAANSVNSSKIVDLSIANADLANASVTVDKLGADVGLWTVASGNAYRSTGNVGIGTALMNAGRRLTLGGVGGICIGEEQTAGNTSLIMSLSAVTNGYANIQAVKNQGGSLGDIILNGGGGNVGIGMTAPPQKLSISNGVVYQDAIVGWEDVFQIARGGVVKAGISMDVAGTSLRLFTGASSATPRLTISAGGNVGIGTTSPGRRLHVGDEGVSGSVGVIRVGHNNGAGSFRTWDFGIGDSSIFGAVDNFGFRDLSGGTVMVLGANGNVGIGTTTPTQAKLVVNGAGANFALGTQGFLNNSSPTGIGGSTNGPLSIYATNDVASTTFRAFSDARIKLIQGLSVGGTDLAMLRGIQVTDYLYKDAVSKGNRPQKKVIAQQVEQIFPQAVSQVTDVVPDIYQRGAFQNGWVVLKTNLKKGERVRLTDDKTTDVFEVLDVAEGKFRTVFKPEGDKVFVYGREVKDFRTVDYEAISMLNVSATQELARKVEALEKANAEKDTALTAMTQRLAALEAKDKARDAKLAAIEAMLSGDKPAALPVSLKKSVGGAE